MLTYFLFFLFGISLTANAHKPETESVPVEDWNPAFYPEFQGTKPTAFTEDSAENLLIGTRFGGVFRYDGYSFEQTGFGKEPVYDLVTGSDGVTYACSDRGVFAENADGWQLIFPKKESFLWYVFDLAVASDGALWGAGIWGAVKIYHGKVTVFAAPYVVEAFRELDVGVDEWHTLPESVSKMCVKTRSGTGVGLEILPSLSLDYQAPVLKVFPGSGAEKAGIRVGDTLVKINGSLNPFDQLLKQPEGVALSLTIRAREGGKAKKMSVVCSSYSGAVPQIGFSAVCVSKRGEVFFGGRFGGIAVYSPQEESWRAFRRFGNQTIRRFSHGNNIIEDGNGVIRAVVDGKILRFDDGKWYHESKGQMFAASAFPLVDGRVAVCSYSRIQVIANGAYQSPIEMPGEVLEGFESSSGRLWFSGTSLFSLSGFGGETMLYRDVEYIGADVGGTDWFLGADGTIVRKKGEQWSSEAFGEKTLKLFVDRYGLIWAVAVEDDEMVLGCFENGKWHRSTINFSGHKPDRIVMTETERGLLWLYLSEKRGRRMEGLFLTDFSGASPVVAEFSSMDPVHYPIAMGYDGKLVWGGNPRLAAFLPNNPSLNGIRHVYEIPIESICGGQDGTLWVGTQSRGVVRVDKSGLLSEWRRSDGIAGERITAVCCGEGNTVWAGNKNGLFRFDGSSWTGPVFPSFFHTNPPRNRNTSSLVVGKNEELWLNSNDGAWLLFSEKDAPQTRVLTPSGMLQYHGNTSVLWEGNDRFNETPQEKLKYSYSINGGQWSVFSSKRELLMKNLKPGDYRIEVKARDLMFNEDATPAVVSFHVLLPVWRQPAVVVPILILAITTLYLLRKLLQAHDAGIRREAEFDRKMVEKNLEMNEMRLRFFTGVSHEFRTPLTLMLLPLEKLLKKDPENKAFRLLRRNVERLLELVGQVLDLRKIDANNLNLTPVKADVASFLHDLTMSFREMSDYHGIRLEWKSECESFQAHFDHDKLTKVLTNLLSNAFKYTSKKGIICVRFDAEEEQYRFSVRDTGRGILEDELPHVFERFYQAKTHVQGTGVGLALCKELVQLHGGEISLESKEGEGTVFAVTLPVEPIGAVPMSQSDVVVREPEADEESVHAPEGERILVVDDNEEIRSFLTQELTQDYHVFEAENGEQALAMAKRENPSLIVSDIMMPIMDGMEFCRKLKTTSSVSHIPVILLTARGSEKSKLSGLKTGADDYVTKPFSMSLLKARISNLLYSRRLLREKFTRQVVVQPSEITVTTLDEEFLTDAVAFVEKHLDEESLNAEMISKALSVSRSGLYNKLQAITGQTVHEFIRSIRLKRAAQILKKGDQTVGEIAFQVGFNDLSYFNRCFKKEYGCTPTQFRKKEQKQV